MTAVAPASLRLATRNAEVLLAALARTRGQELVRRPGFVAMNGPGLLRVLLLGPDPAADDVAEISRLVAEAEGRTTVEDPFGTVDGTPWPLVPRQLPVMIRQPSPLPDPELDVTRVTTAEELAVAERTVLDGFPLPGFAPGEAFPPALFEDDTARMHIARRDGAVAGACVTVLDESAAGVYWVTTLPEHRSRGVGRALMHQVLNEVTDRPMTLSAAVAGKPLYDSLGFATTAVATWWSTPA
ncbi:ribosomal protein S18 acetylase RimI-like enzyme [Saccharothrix tamanrassetensis]|uniref:Ribosomal protein S18 acetylase RimI-like enzyme n=1 Tax=Saccharothrix tamanrassetensis TaxID=1051531 RepID=A0A841CAN1_9PSEU|nr:GNAT family N-acetyltransferase [Saccharothrix tamanrassetensis]MBB5954003.1 ribosomal protein S18 acetylase RimI-like enzyme [Saccharothrix tamanrassetensis]